MDATLLLQSIARHITLSPEEQAHFMSILHYKAVKKKQFLTREGDISRGPTFVISGLLRSYSIDNNGNEHVIQFAPPGWWVGDLGSMIHQRPSILSVDALEDSEVIFITEADIEDLYERIPKFERFWRILTQNALAAHQARLVNILSLPAKARYAEFCRLYPSLIDCLPQKQIASYIGVTPEFLSKMLNTRA
ncbi:MAG TPA: Crp/Fnr family transcriptional regulator [Puia sp.]|uniref:Crp/Fnr family transcriptional regulator n=1 Tax=Puia sp. TaxID=2045100 RepID=UPI002D0D22D5|nr:Crp/Fnr family transcriptional regulator [Puia sp.]HVU98611.1 Crp/Fnr family transcriptional regulator [Puia sp.]